MCSGVGKAREAVAAEIATGNPAGAHVSPRAGSAAVARRTDTRGAVDVDARVALVGDERLADVDPSAS